MIFLDLEHLLQSEFGISLNELLYKTDQKKRIHLIQKVMDLSSRLKTENHYNRIIHFFSEKRDQTGLYNFLRYYVEFPIFTAEKHNQSIISDYQYVSDDVPLEYLDVANELNIEIDFNKIKIEENKLTLSGYAFIPFINFEENDALTKRLILVDGKKETETILNNIETEETIELGSGIYYYPYAGFEETIEIDNLSSLRCFLELETNDKNKYRKYCFDIEQGIILIDTERQRAELNSIIRKVNEPELLFVESTGNKVNLYLSIDDYFMNTLAHSPYKIATISSNNAKYNYSEIVKKDIEAGNIKYLNRMLLKYEINTSVIVDEVKSYLVFNFGSTKQDIKYVDSQQWVLDHKHNTETGMYISIFSNKKNNIELHVQKNAVNNKIIKEHDNNIFGLLRKVKARLKV